MVNNDIITALKNSIEHGDSLQNSINILINSGYNSQEVYEASRFVGGGALNLQQIKSTEQLAMPTKKILPKSNIPPSPNYQIQQPIQTNPNSFYPKQTMQQNPPQLQATPQNRQYPQYQQPIPQIPNTQNEIQQIKQEISSQDTMIPIPSNQVTYSVPAYPSQSKTTSLSSQLNKIAPPKQTYFKEIILVIVLLMLIAILIATLLFKDPILKFLSSLFG